MKQTHIYIAVDSCTPRPSKKNYGYILECEVSGEAVTRDGYGQSEGSYHKAVLDALGEALERFTRKSEVTIHTEDDFILNMMVSNLAKWSENGFLTAKGKPVANQAEWIRVWEASKNHVIHAEPGRHTYSGWLSGEINRRKEQSDV